MRVHHITALFVLVTLTPLIHGDAPAPAIYAQDFEKLAEGKPPAEFLILHGAFHVRKVEGNSVLELAPHPIDHFGVKFGSDSLNRGTVSARIQAFSTGKRYPEFGIGALGGSGVRLWLMPATGQLQLLQGDHTVAQVPFKWASGQWTRMKLSFAIENGKAMVRGKAWPDGAPEPEKWMLEFEDTQSAKPDRASLWATPYSTQVTRFDDLKVEGK